MDNKTQFEWVEFYTAFSKELLKYENNRKGLLDKLIAVYDDLKMKFPKLEENESIIDIDPFTVYGLFNKGITEANRVSVIRALAKAFNISADVQIPTSFNGVPVLNNLKAVFFGWNRNGTSDIDNLWKLFRIASAYADDKNNNVALRGEFISIYNDVIKQNCIKWNITMGLFWIRPYKYLNLDSRTRWYITNYCVEIIGGDKRVLNNVPQGEKYLSLCDMSINALGGSKYQYHNLCELSFEAFAESERVNLAQKTESEDSIIVDENENAVHYWLFAPGTNASRWEDFYNAGIMAIDMGDIGDLSTYESKEQMREAMRKAFNKPDTSFKNDGHAAWQFAKEMKEGDIIIAKRGNYEIIGRGIVESAYIYDNTRPNKFWNVRKVRWTHKGKWEHPWHPMVAKTLTDITPYTDTVRKINALFESEGEEEIEIPETIYPPYSADDFLKEVYMSDIEYNILVDLVKEKKNIILQGAPGVGKTYAAKRLAYSIMGVQDSNRVMMIQFHQSYSYEDFIMGYRPTEKGGFELHKGPFYEFCKLAESDNENDYFFIIDEINRGNLSKIFGELFMLIESDKRSKVRLQLLYSNEKFTVPANVHIIGMMNTADRSLAMLDYALRRRFAFFEMKPGFSTDRFIEYRQNLNEPRFDRLINSIEMLNKDISDDEALGDGFRIGHSYFCNLKNGHTLSNIVEYEIIPLLKEYWFDEPNKVANWSNILRSAIK